MLEDPKIRRGSPALSFLPPLSDAAVFFDFDGVLVDIADAPDAVAVHPTLPLLLGEVHDRVGGALALVTGRALDDIRSHLTDPPGWIAGCHGGERASPLGGDDLHPLTNSPGVAAVKRSVTALASVGPGVLTETKPLGAVVHFRAAPGYRRTLESAARMIAAANPDFEVHPAKMAFELRPADVGKDKVVTDWMDRTPFKGRTPVYFGDDLTDEPAMDVVQAMGGVALKVGAGDTVASYRLDDPDAVRDLIKGWLAAGQGAT